MEHRVSGSIGIGEFTELLGKKCVLLKRLNRRKAEKNQREHMVEKILWRFKKTRREDECNKHTLSSQSNVGDEVTISFREVELKTLDENEIMPISRNEGRQY